MTKIKVGILGSGNIGTDLMYKILKNDGDMELALLSGIDPESEGLLRARDHGDPYKSSRHRCHLGRS